MNQAGATRGEERTGLEKVLSCGCWDCVAYRRAAMKIALGVTLIIGFGGGLVVGWDATHSQAAMSSSGETAQGP
jgi:hypothetical protein